jgi:hypothetical protein
VLLASNDIPAAITGAHLVLSDSTVFKVYSVLQLNQVTYITAFK